MTGDPTRDAEATPHHWGGPDEPVEDEYAQHQRRQTIREGRALVTADWLITHGDDLLHHATPTNDQAAALIDQGAVLDGLTLACGQTVEWAAVPGLGDRMGLVRCAACCDVVGLPRGKQSPKNDYACREALGMDKEDT